MLDIPINNPEILETLDKFLWFYNEREGEVAQCRLWCNNEDRDHFTGDNHRDSIMSRGSIHNGYPENGKYYSCLLYTSPSPRDRVRSRMPSSA